MARASEAFSAHVALEAREEIAIEKAQVAVGEIVGGLMLPAEKSSIDAMLVEAEKEGVYFGQCSELCGLNHAYMPIVVKVVSQKSYEDWLIRSNEAFANKGKEINKNIKLAEKK